jgi:putative DNA primase/helicase
LSGKRIFIDDDVHDGIKLPDGTLKTISERKLLMGELKHKNKFPFESRVVPVLLCNNVPRLTDVSQGMFRRLQVIPFDTTFTPRTADPNLFNRIWASEMPGVLNQAIEGWTRLQERSRFLLPSPVVQATHRWFTYANPLAGFLEDHCSSLPQAQVLLKDFYAAYCKWLKLTGITAVQPNAKIRLQLEQQGFVTKKSNKGVSILGLKLKSANHTASRRQP